MTFNNKNFLNIIEKYILILLGIFVILPFFVISYFNNPTSDDYCLASDVKNLGYIGAQTYWYENWGGRYASISMVCLRIVNEEYLYWYKIFPILLMMFFIVALYFLIKEIFKDGSILFCLKTAVLLFVLYISQMPIVSEGFFWWSGAMTYQLANILTLVLLRCLVVALREKNLLVTLEACVIIFCLIGCNEVSMLLVNLLLLLIIGFNYLYSKKWNIQIIVMLAIAILSSTIVYFAPGHFLRQDSYVNNERFVYSLIMSFLQFGFSFMFWTGLTFLTALIIYREIILSFNKKILRKVFSIPIGYATVIFFGLTFFGFFIGFWATGEPLAPRARNVVYLFYILGLIFLFLNIFQQKSDFSRLLEIKRNLQLVVIMCFLSIFIGKENVKNVFVDLVKKKAYNYNKELVEREKNTKSSDRNANLIVKPILSLPKTIFVNDIKSDKNHYYNKCYSNYWNLNSVISEK